MNWHETTLGEICEKDQGLVQTGPFGSQLHQSDYKETGVPVVMPKDIKDDKISTDSIARISIEDVQRLKRHKLKIGDIIFPRRGEINKRAITTEKEQGWICGTGCLKISVGGKVAAPDYLYYYLGQRDVVKWIENQAIGATMANLNTSILKSVPINLPPLPLQRKIAAILSAYDELIENNNRRIAILEQMAEEVYKEWFVRMRFPGWREVRFVEGVPERWKWRKFDSDVKILSGGTPSTTVSDYWGGEIPFFTPKDSTSHFIVNETEKRITQKGLKNCNSSLFPPGTIFITARGTVGKLNMNAVPMAMNQTCYAFQPKKGLSKYLLFFQLKSLVSLLQKIATGATFSAITVRDFENQKILKPDAETIRKFDAMMHPIFENISILLEKNELLRQTRDLLLPRLVSGKLGVEHLVEAEVGR